MHGWMDGGIILRAIIIKAMILKDSESLLNSFQIVCKGLYDYCTHYYTSWFPGDDNLLRKCTRVLGDALV